MRTRIILMLCCTLALAACGDSRNDKAAAACQAEMTQRMNGRSFSVDVKALAASAKSESADTLFLTAPVVLDQGLSNEDKQTGECRVRFDAAGTPSVLYVQFNWNTSDLKRAQ